MNRRRVEIDAKHEGVSVKYLNGRIVLGVLSLAIATAAWVFEEHGQLATLLAGSVGIIILHREVGALAAFILRKFTGAGKKVVERAKKVEEGRKCSICSAPIFPIGYRVDTVIRPTRLFAERRAKNDEHGVPQEKESTYLLSAPKFTVCKRHHPNIEISNDKEGAEEFSKYLVTKFPHATWERVYPIMVE
jgi:hypothetical protein